jgi:hypothetical protein
MELEITPQPDDQERAAIEAALRQEREETRPSAWADEALPSRNDDSEP